MAEPFQTYQKTIKLPCDGVESGRACKTELDANIIKVASSLGSSSKQLQYKLDKDAAGHLNATIKTGSYVISLQTQFGQNVAYRSGERQTFTSYSIRAESRVPALDRAAESAERLKLLLKMVGGLVGAGLFFGVLTAMFRAFDHVVIPVAFVAMSLIFGAWCGGKLGDCLAAAVENRALGHAEAKGVTSEADSLWSTLTQKLDRITSPYEKA